LHKINEHLNLILSKIVYNCRVHWDDPVTVRLSGGLSVFSSPPPGSGSVLGAILKVMDLFDLDERKAEDPLTFHRFGYHTQWIPLNGITLGQTITDLLNGMITITKYISFRSVVLRYIL
jgi:hypothetical protein